ncbi:MAG TPA: hypothetical protein VI755_00210 [Anaerolineales bacterium]|nr:hypothetical protein [Anaerolineales bacterium]
MAELLNEAIKNQVREVFSQLEGPVQVLFFGQERDCEYCDDTRQLAEEVTALSDKLELKVYDLEGDAEIAQGYHVDKVPALVFAARDGEVIHDYGLRMAGIPAGHEFNSLIHDLILVSRRDSGLSQKTRDLLARLSKPVFLQVFVTPT